MVVWNANDHFKRWRTSISKYVYHEEIISIRESHSTFLQAILICVLTLLTSQAKLSSSIQTAAPNPWMMTIIPTWGERSRCSWIQFLFPGGNLPLLHTSIMMIRTKAQMMAIQPRSTPSICFMKTNQDRRSGNKGVLECSRERWMLISGRRMHLKLLGQYASHHSFFWQ